MGQPEFTHSATSQTFRLANGCLVPALSKILIDTPIGRLQVYIIETDSPTGPVPPILLGTRSLEALQAEVNYEAQRISFTGVQGRYSRSLTKNSRGHILLDVGDGCTGLPSPGVRGG